MQVSSSLPLTQQVLVVLTNAPDAATAERIAAELVTRRCAACVNILAPCTSIYRWQGALERSDEVPLLIKTTVLRYAEVERVVRELHPYELPEIVAVPIERGLTAYLEWVTAQVSGSDSSLASNG